MGCGLRGREVVDLKDVGVKGDEGSGWFGLAAWLCENASRSQVSGRDG